METILNAIAWPASALLFAIVFIVVFKRPLVALLDRTKKLGKGGIETYDQQQLPAPPPKGDALAQFMGMYNNPLLSQVEASIRTDLTSGKLDAPADAQTALVRALAGTRIQLHFEQVYAAVWASQVQLLRYLNGRLGFVSVEEVRPFYQSGSAQFPALYQQYGFDAYLGFLESHFLIERQALTAQVTLAGREFLKWLVDAKKPGPFQG